jgi:predicted nucleic acid-binding protein
VIVPDSSVLIAALAEWHPAHEASRAALKQDDRALIAHAAIEATSVLSRMPEPYRVTTSIVLDGLVRDYPSPWLALSGLDQQAFLSRAVDAGLLGGALYDALIAATAREHGATLLSADRRAREAYEAIGVEVSYIEQFQITPTARTSGRSRRA